MFIILVGRGRVRECVRVWSWSRGFGLELLVRVRGVGFVNS